MEVEGSYDDLEREFEEFEERFNSIDNELKSVKKAIQLMGLRNAHEREQFDGEYEQIAMLGRHGIEIKN